IGREFAHLPFEANRISVISRGRDDRVERRLAAVLHEDFQLLRVQLTMRHKRVVAGIGPDEQLDAQLARLVHELAEKIKVPLHSIDVELHMFSADSFPKLHRHREECTGWDYRN